jgi:DNA topoisomerase II
MHAFDMHNTLVKYRDPYEIVLAHYEARLEGYGARKTHLLGVMSVEDSRARNRARFVDAILKGEIELTSGGRPQSSEYMVKALTAGGYDTINQLTSSLDSADGTAQQGYRYLLSMPIESLTSEKSQELKAKADVIARSLEELRRSSLEDMWIRDLDELETELLKDPGLNPTKSSVAS